MRAEGHLENVVREERSTLKLDPAEDCELIIEGAYGAAHHHIAHGLQLRHVEHSDKHQNDFLILTRHGHADVRAAFETLDSLRAGDFYGGRMNGGRVALARRLLAAIKAWAVPS